MPDTNGNLTIDEVNSQFDDLQSAVNKFGADSASVITSLKAQISAGTPVTPAQLTALGARFKAVTDAVNAFDINTTDSPVVPDAPVPPAA